MNIPSISTRRFPARVLHLLAVFIRSPQRLAAAALVALILTYSPARVQAGNQEPNSAASSGAQVNIQNFTFSPQVVVVKVGDSVTWTNLDNLVIHTTTSDTAVWDSGDLSTGQTFTHTFNTPGSYAYHCMHHPLIMTGTVIVVKPEIYLPVMLKLN